VRHAQTSPNATSRMACVALTLQPVQTAVIV
jgi:hypothetical protein